MSAITKKYWCVRDTNPATQVFTTDPAQGAAVGTMIANNNATFESWLQLHDENQQMPIIASSPTTNNGSGKIRVPVSNTSFLQTGMVFDYVGNVTGDLGCSAITVVDATHIDFGALAFTVADSAPVCYGATFIDTFVNLCDVINTFNVNNLSANVYLGVNNPSMSGDITLTNPMLFVQEINNSGAGHSLILPQMNLPYSLPIGVPVTITNTDSPSTGIAFGIKNASGAPLWPTLYGSDTLTFVLTSNATTSGTFLVLEYLPGTITGNLLPPTAAAQIPITQTSRIIQWKALTGDISITSGGLTALLNIPDTTPMAGDVIAATRAAPSIPSAGHGALWFDSTDSRFHDKADSGAVGTTVVSDTGASHNFLTGISVAGAITKAQPSSADLSDTVSVGSWTPSDQSGASLTFTSVSVEYERVGNIVRVFGRFTFPATASGANVSIGGLPITVPNRTSENSPGPARLVGKGIAVIATPVASATTFGLRNAVSDAQLTNADCSSLVLVFNFTYSAT